MNVYYDRLPICLYKVEITSPYMKSFLWDCYLNYSLSSFSNHISSQATFDLKNGVAPSWHPHFQFNQEMKPQLLNYKPSSYHK